jgi:predicted nucleic acid-binding protein
MSEATDKSDSPLVVCDSKVLYPIVIADLILSLGTAEVFHPRWTDQIHEECMRNLLADRPDLNPANVERRRKQMDAAIDDCLIEGYEHLISGLSLPDQDDRHVLTATIHGNAQVILTFNQRHFPKMVLVSYGISAEHPDNFLSALMGRSAEGVISAIEEMKARKTRPSISWDELLRKIENQRLTKFAVALRNEIPGR